VGEREEAGEVVGEKEGADEGRAGEACAWGAGGAWGREAAGCA